MNFDLFEKKMNEAFVILDSQKKNAKAAKRKYERVLENARAICCAEVEAEKLGTLSDSEIKYAASIKNKFMEAL